MKFECPSCGTKLQAEPDHAGKVVRCPGCDTKLQIPAQAPTPPAVSVPKLNIPAPSAIQKQAQAPAEDIEEEPTEEEAQAPRRGGLNISADREPVKRKGWDETDHSNPNMLAALGIGVGATAFFLLILLPFAPKPEVPTSEYTTMQYLAMVWKGHLAVNTLNTLFFFWAIGILILKLQKLRLQRRALLLDILPADLGIEINAHNVGAFIDHLYSLPRRLRDSLMVNRIRRVLELFEGKQNTSDAATLMSAQSDIDSSRVGTSYTLVKAFLWAIPIMGFVGTVMGLSEALLSLNFSNLEDVKAITGVLNGVISGLGGAFDATLVGLVFAMLLNFPMNSLAKAEDDTLNDIDSFCNGVLIPRLNDGGHPAAADPVGMMESLSQAVASAQQEFLGDLNLLSAKIVEYADNLDARAAEHQERVSADFAAALDKMREDMTASVDKSVKTTTEYTRALATGIGALNEVLTKLGEKQVTIHQTIKKGWFSRG